MTRFEKMVEIVAKSYEEDCKEYDCTIKELFKCWQFDKEDMIDEFCSILNETEYAEFVTDECEIFDDDGTIKTFRQFSMAVKKYEF
jgi:hypothetical protein